MSQSAKEAGGTGPSHRKVEIGFTLFMGFLGALSIIGALQVGIGWGAEGPKAGFFPFYVGLIVVLSTVVNLINAIRLPDGVFAEWPALGQVVSVVVPMTIYVLAIPYLGMYVSSAILIAAFMKYFGRYSWLLSIAIGVAVPIAIFFMFEIWFLVPLPKGPVESYLGY
jgi:putative tricarboxylic transport membrane protein